MRPFSSSTLFNPRRPSLLRANILVLGSLLLSFPLSGFPNARRDPLLVAPFLFALCGMAETVRCVQPRWNFYHGGVILLLFMDMLVLYVILFFLIFPYLF